MLGLAYGAGIVKLRFGHHGGNQPVLDQKLRRVEITAQNHNYAVDAATLEPEQVEITHMNLNDHTVEGMRHRRYPILSVQYHPEAGPGPHDGTGLFGNFLQMVDEHRRYGNGRN